MHFGNCDIHTCLVGFSCGKQPFPLSSKLENSSQPSIHQSLMVCACDQNTLQEDSILVSLKTKGQGQLVMSWTVSYRALWTPLVCPYGQTSIYRPPPTRPLQRVMKETENEEPN